MNINTNQWMELSSSSIVSKYLQGLGLFPQYSIVFGFDLVDINQNLDNHKIFINNFYECIQDYLIETDIYCFSFRSDSQYPCHCLHNYKNLCEDSKEVIKYLEDEIKNKNIKTEIENQSFYKYNIVDDPSLTTHLPFIIKNLNPYFNLITSKHHDKDNINILLILSNSNDVVIKNISKDFSCVVFAINLSSITLENLSNDISLLSLNKTENKENFFSFSFSEIMSLFKSNIHVSCFYIISHLLNFNLPHSPCHSPLPDSDIQSESDYQCDNYTPSNPNYIILPFYEIKYVKKKIKFPVILGIKTRPHHLDLDYDSDLLNDDFDLETESEEMNNDDLFNDLDDHNSHLPFYYTGHNHDTDTQSDEDLFNDSTNLSDFSFENEYSPIQIP